MYQYRVPNTSPVSPIGPVTPNSSPVSPVGPFPSPASLSPSASKKQSAARKITKTFRQNVRKTKNIRATRLANAASRIQRKYRSTQKHSKTQSYLDDFLKQIFNASREKDIIKIREMDRRYPDLKLKLDLDGNTAIHILCSLDFNSIEKQSAKISGRKLCYPQLFEILQSDSALHHRNQSGQRPIDIVNERLQIIHKKIASRKTVNPTHTAYLNWLQKHVYVDETDISDELLK